MLSYTGRIYEPQHWKILPTWNLCAACREACNVHDYSTKQEPNSSNIGHAKLVAHVACSRHARLRMQGHSSNFRAYGCTRHMHSTCSGPLHVHGTQPDPLEHALPCTKQVRTAASRERERLRERGGERERERTQTYMCSERPPPEAQVPPLAARCRNQCCMHEQLCAIPLKN